MRSRAQISREGNRIKGWFSLFVIEEQCLVKFDKSVENELPEDKEEDEDLKEKEKKNKARLRTRGPYRKAHADW